MRKLPLMNNRLSDIQSFFPFHCTRRTVMCEFWRSSHWVQWRDGCGSAGSNSWLTAAAALPRDYRVKQEVIVGSCRRSRRRLPLVSHYYIIVLCLRNSDKWRRRLDAVDGLDWALTRLMWQTYLDRPTIFHINWLNLARSRETDRENGYENWTPVFSHEWRPSFDVQDCSHNLVGQQCRLCLSSQQIHVPGHITATSSGLLLLTCHSTRTLSSSHNSTVERTLQ